VTVVAIDRIRDSLNIQEIISHSPVAGIVGADKKLMMALRISEVSWVGRVDNEVVCVWGLVPPTVMSNNAYLWLLTTDKVDNHQFLFVRHSQLMVDMMLQDYEILVGNCNIRQPKSIRCLKWLGARLGEPNGEWIPFQIRKKNG
jgi:hypothetical protein